MRPQDTKAIAGSLSYRYTPEKVGKANLDVWIELDKTKSKPYARADTDKKYTNTYWHEEAYDVVADADNSNTTFARTANYAEGAVSMTASLVCSSTDAISPFDTACQ